MFSRAFPTYFVCLIMLGLCGGAVAAQVRNLPADSLNQVDEQGRKQGWWRIVAPAESRPGYGPGDLIEEGRYVDNRRNGPWKRYWPSGLPQSEVNYVKGLAKGNYVIYYPDGKPEEKGSWDLDRNTGTFKRWHPNGNLAQEFIFDANGQRDGMQRYYHENGNTEVEVKIVKGREEGVLKRYWPNGELRETAHFQDGAVEAGTFRNFKPKGPAAMAVPVANTPVAPARTEQERPNAKNFDAEGWNTLYDAELRLSQKGFYKKGRLWNGKVYQYDRNGILNRIEVYMEGRYVGRAPLTDDDR